MSGVAKGSFVGLILTKSEPGCLKLKTSLLIFPQRHHVRVDLTVLLDAAEDTKPEYIEVGTAIVSLSTINDSYATLLILVVVCWEFVSLFMLFVFFKEIACCA